MSAGGVIAIIVIVVVVAAVAAAVYGLRQRQLRRRFGPEYDRLVGEYHSRRKAEAELAGRQRRVRGLDIRPLDPATQDRYLREWDAVQEWFVDAPQRAVAEGQRLVMTVMNERGYPTEQDGQMLADLSVDHVSVLDHYRGASAISERAAAGTVSTEDLRQALIHYRALFNELLGEPREPARNAGSAGPARQAGTAEPGRGAAGVSNGEAEAPASPAGTAPATADGTTSAPAANEAPSSPQADMPSAAPGERTPSQADATTPAGRDGWARRA